MKTRLRLLMPALLATIIVFAAPLQLRAERFYVAGAPESDTVRFESQAKLEFIEGTTHSIVGYLDFVPANPAFPVSGKLRVDAASLKTGIDLRDEHMRERHLQTNEYPFVGFELQSVVGLPAVMTPGTSFPIEVSGQFTVHGVTKAIKAKATATVTTGADGKPMLAVTARFPIKLDDYGVPRPKALFLKLAETLDITVTFVASPANPKVEL